MIKAPEHPTESLRLAALLRYQVLDSEDEAIFDNITRLAALICQKPIALVSLVDKDRQWFKSNFGLHAKETPRDVSFCGHAIHGKEIFEIKDAHKDKRFFDNPLVMDGPLVRFYAGAPLIAADGHALGTLCVIDHVESSLTEQQKMMLDLLAQQVVMALDLRIHKIRTDEVNTKLDHLLEAMSEGLVVHNDKGEIVEYNQTALNILGLTGNQLLGRDSMDPNWKTIRENGEPFPGAEHPALKALLTGQKQLHTIMGVQKPNAALSWIKINAVPLFKKDSPKPDRVLVTFADITDAVQTYSELRQMSEALDQCASVYHIDIKGKIIKANSLAVQTSGHAAEDLLSSEYSQANAIRSTLLNPTSADQSDASPSSWRAQICNKQPNGSLCWEQAVVIPIANFHRDIEKFMAIHFDITTQKELESQLIQASKMSTLGEMAGGIAHEVNNPLFIIRGRTHKLKILARLAAKDPDQIIQCCESIDETVDRIAAIIRSLRSFSRDGSHDPFQQVQVCRIVDDTLALCLQKIRRSNIEFHTETIETDLYVQTRPTQLSQLLLNLLSNAYDSVVHLNRPWISLNITSNDGMLKIIVADSGPGVSIENQKKIFQPFFTTKEVGAGTGLGLSICKGIADAHHGTLVYDQTDAVCRFILTIPLLQSHELAA